MKQLLLLTIMSIGYLYTNAQVASSEVVVNPLIYDFYPASKVEIMLNEEPEMLVFWNAIYEYGFDLRTIYESEEVTINEYPEIEVENIREINILGLNLYPMKGKTQYFRIKDTNKLLILKSEESIRKLLTKEN